MQPTAEEVRDLRNETGAGMMECKKALIACNNDKTKAIDFLKTMPLYPVMRDRWIGGDVTKIK